MLMSRMAWPSGVGGSEWPCQPFPDELQAPPQRGFAGCGKPRGSVCRGLRKQVASTLVDEKDSVEVSIEVVTGTMDGGLLITDGSDAFQLLFRAAAVILNPGHHLDLAAGINDLCTILLCLHVYLRLVLRGDAGRAWRPGLSPHQRY